MQLLNCKNELLVHNLIISIRGTYGTTEHIGSKGASPGLHCLPATPLFLSQGSLPK